MSAAIFGNVSSIMLRVYQGTEEFHEMQTSIKEFINFHHIPKHMANRLIESYQHSWTYTNGIDMNSVSITKLAPQPFVLMSPLPECPRWLLKCWNCMIYTAIDIP